MSDRGTEKNSIFSVIQYKAGIMASIPSLLLCAMLYMMLILDVILPDMSDRQYIVFPVAARIVSLISILCMAACFGSELDGDRVRFDLKDLFFALFSVCMLISTAVNGITHDALFSVAYRYVGVYDLLIYIFVYMYCAGRSWKKGLKNAFFIFFMLLSDLTDAAFLFNCFTGSIAAFNNKLEPSAVFFHGNHYGYFLVMAVAVSAGYFIHSKGKAAAFGAVSLVMNLASLALNRSMGSIMAAGAVLLVMTVISAVLKGTERRCAFIMMGAIILGAVAAIVIIRPLREDLIQTAGEFLQVLSGDNNIYAGNGRWGIWQYVAEYVADYPWWGYGCEGIAEIMKSYTLTTSPHNEPLTYAAFFGIPAAVFYCAGVITCIVKGLKNSGDLPENRIAAYAAMGYFISSLFGLAVFYTAPFMFVFLGLSSARANYSNFE